MAAAPDFRDSGRTPDGALALGVAGIAALLASSCCVAPLALALAGISGAWIGQLRRMAPYSPWLMGLAVLALAVAAWRLYRPLSARTAACEAAAADTSCRRVGRVARRWFWVVAVLTLIPIVVPMAAPWFY
jgi:mercuric ion transport protein